MIIPGLYLDTSVISALFDERTPERKAMTEAAWARFPDYSVYISSKPYLAMKPQSRLPRAASPIQHEQFGMRPAIAVLKRAKFSLTINKHPLFLICYLQVL